MNNKLLTIRIGRHSLSFSMPTTEDEEQPVSFEPYVLRSGISMAANLREAFKTAELPLSMPADTARRTRVMIDAPVLVVPVEQFEESQITQLFRHSYPTHEGEEVHFNVLPDLNAVALFAMNKDLHTVLNDNFAEVRLVHAISPVWRHLHKRSFTGSSAKLYAYFHEKQMELFSFQQNRFRFCNTFQTNRAHDALYFTLYVARELVLRQEYDEIHLVGDIPDEEWLLTQLRKYVKKSYVINPAADFSQSPLADADRYQTPITELKNMPYDLLTLYVKGR